MALCKWQGFMGIQEYCKGPVLKMIDVGQYWSCQAFQANFIWAYQKYLCAKKTKHRCRISFLPLNKSTDLFLVFS